MVAFQTSLTTMSRALVLTVGVLVKLLTIQAMVGMILGRLTKEAMIAGDPPRVVVVAGAELAGAELAGAELAGAEVVGAEVVGAEVVGVLMAVCDYGEDDDRCACYAIGIPARVSLDRLVGFLIFIVHVYACLSGMNGIGLSYSA